MTSSPTDERAPVIAALVDELLHHAPSGRRFVAIDGADGAGKTVFAVAVAEALTARGVEAVRASLDDFGRPRAERYARGRDSAFGFYHDAFDLEAFRSRLVVPFRAGGSEPETTFETAIFDLERDAPAPSAPRTAGPDAVLVVDGLFLHRPELKGIWHFSIWLEVPLEERRRRLADRDGLSTDPDDPLVRRYEGAQALYWDDAHPNVSATAIIDNADPAAPSRRFADFCVAPPRTR